MTAQQLIISGVGGQGILFITRLLAATAITKGLPVLTSETHGMAQRGGIVISHLKIGDFASPLIRPGQADGLIALTASNVALHRPFLRADGWIAANSAEPLCLAEPLHEATIDADQISRQMGNPRAVNLIVLGRALASDSLFCTADEVSAVLRQQFAGRPAQLDAALAAITAA